MRSRILTGWNFVRILWLFMGLGVTVQAVNERNFLMLIPALYFVFAAIANVGCFAGSCATNLSDKKTEAATEVKYDETQSKG